MATKMSNRTAQEMSSRSKKKKKAAKKGEKVGFTAEEMRSRREGKIREARFVNEASSRQKAKSRLAATSPSPRAKLLADFKRTHGGGLTEKEGAAMLKKSTSDSKAKPGRFRKSLNSQAKGR